MAVHYVAGNFEIHGLRLKTEKELDELILVMEAAMRTVHPSLGFNNDIDLEVTEKAGKFEEEEMVEFRKEGADQ